MAERSATFEPDVAPEQRRALTRAGILSWADLSEWTSADLARLPGVGTATIGDLNDGLGRRGLSLADAERAAGRTDVDDYISQVDMPQREALTDLRAALGRLFPTGHDAISYAMPAWVIAGKPVAGYAAFKQHWGYFPHSGSVAAAAGDAISAYTVSAGGGGISIPPDESLPDNVIKRLVRLRLAELGDVRNGKRIEFFPNGAIKAIGQMRSGAMSGSWKWFRKDGSLMRTGSFRAGSPSGVWTTFDEHGHAVKLTDKKTD